MEKIEVLYIAGSGRSGSTLLEMILGNLPGFISIGEARYFWEYAFHGNVRCGCGKPLLECSLWSRVISHMESERDINLSRISKINSKLNRTRNTPIIQLRSQKGFNDNYRELIDLTHLFYSNAWRESNKKVLVDSSKVPSQLAILREIPQISLKIIHLVRDGRAVSYSWSKRKKKEIANIYIDNYMPNRSALRSMLTWTFENYYTLRLTSDLPRTLLKYEVFVDGPKTALGAALNSIGFSSIDLNFLNNKCAKLNYTHSIGGNPIRFNKHNLDISADLEWELKLSPFYKKFLGLIGFPLLSHFGYKL